MKKILVIKHGSLGDIIIAIPAMISIRKKHPNALIHLITEKKYISLLSKSKIFDRIIIDNRKDLFLKSILNLFKLLNIKYDTIIDLQNSRRTSLYNLFFRLFTNSLISSSRSFAHYRYKIPPQGAETSREGLFNQLKLINIKNNKYFDYTWLRAKLKDQIIQPCVLIIPGTSNEKKQWDPEKFAEIAKYCESKKITVYVVGTKGDLSSANVILKRCKKAINKIECSPPEVIYSIALKSSLIFSNDTGPGHIASLANNHIVWLLNDDKISKANIDANETNHKILSSSVKNITSQKIIQYIEKYKLL